MTRKISPLTRIRRLHAELRATRKVLAASEALALERGRQADSERMAKGKAERIAEDLRRLLPAIQHHKIERNIANNELNHVMLANELAMLRLLVVRGCSVSPDELQEFLAEEQKRADVGASQMTIAARPESVTH